MRIITTILFISLLCLAVHQDARAYEMVTRMPKSAWLVGLALPGMNEKDQHKQCVMATEYDNGFIVRFFASGNHVSAYSIDTRQPALKQGQGFSVRMISGDIYRDQRAMAQNETTLTVATWDQFDWQEFVQSDAFKIQIGETMISFSTKGMSDGFKRLMSCADPNPVEVASNNFEASNVPQIPVNEDAADARAEQSSEEGINVSEVLAEDTDVAEAELNEEAEDKPANPKVLPELIEDTVPREIERPLNVALAMIVPTGYQFKFGSGVDFDVPVRWEEPAGNDWYGILRKSLTAEGYEISKKNKTIVISATEIKSKERLGREYPKAETAAKVLSETPVWTAAQGARLQDVLEDWSEQQGVNLVIDTEYEFLLPEDVTYQAPFEVAVEKLLENFKDDPAAPMGIFQGNARDDDDGAAEEVAMTGEPLDEPISLIQQDDKVLGSGAILPKPDANVWYALEQTSLQETLEQWSRRANVGLVWDTELRFDIRENVKNSNSYEEALTELLEQYKGSSVRPVGELNTDPETGKKVLHIRAHKS